MINSLEYRGFTIDKSVLDFLIDRTARVTELNKWTGAIIGYRLPELFIKNEGEPKETIIRRGTLITMK